MDEFRQQVRHWLLQNCPSSMRTPYQSELDFCWGGRHFKFRSQAQRLWLNCMAEQGWTAPHWPKVYGGGGLNKQELTTLRQEMAAIKARPPIFSFGLWMLGPALLKYGSEQQKTQHLPGIAKGEIRWCQGYSEPNAGSDLASLQTKAEDKGDHYLVNGQKIWTSYADQSDWIFMLVRTNAEASKHQGISFLLVDMTSAGITTRPILLISGASPFCEVFFDQVKVPKQNRVGELDKGWAIAKYLLTHEREMLGAEAFSSADKSAVFQLALKQIGTDDSGRLSDPVLRSQIIKHHLQDLAFQSTVKRTSDQAKAGQSVGAISSALKYYGTELNKKRLELLMVSGGQGALLDQADSNSAKEWLRSKGNSIEGGTSEIQLNIIAKQLLNLPSS